MMHPRFADRIARNICKTKREQGVAASAALAHRALGDKPLKEDYAQVKARIDFWRDKPL